MKELPFGQRMNSPAARGAFTSLRNCRAAMLRSPAIPTGPNRSTLARVVNSPSEDLLPAVSRDGLSFYFASVRPDVGNVGPDLWVSHRTNVEIPWGPAQNLGSTLNMPAPIADNGAALSIDGHRLFFHSNRPGGLGGQDLYVSRRRDNPDDLGWEAPVNLGGAINSSANDTGPAYFEDQDGTVSLYFTSARTRGLGGNDIYMSTIGPTGVSVRRYWSRNSALPPMTSVRQSAGMASRSSLLRIELELSA
jgi:hypothetical protein